MQYNIGDKVKFLNDIGTGTVSKIIDKKNVLVINEYDFEVPVNTNELILVEAAPTEKLYTQNVTPDVKKTIEPETLQVESEPVFIKELGNEMNLYLAFVKDPSKDNDEFQTFLINDSNYNLYFTFSLKKEGNWQLFTYDKLEANTKVQLKNISRELINKKTEILIQSISFSNRLSEIKEPISETIKLNPIKFFNKNSFKDNDFFEEPAVIISIYSESKILEAIEALKKADFHKIIKEKEDISNNKINTLTPAKSKVEEVDLHLQEVIDDPTGLTKADMLEAQLNIFRNKLNDAIKNKQKKIVFIHGIGNGRLKSELRREIDSKYKNCKYQDASFQQYGFGATLVLIY